MFKRRVAMTILFLMWAHVPAGRALCADPGDSIPESVRQVIAKAHPNAVLLIVNARAKTDGTPYDATYIFRSPTAQQQIWVQVPPAGPPTAMVLDFPSDGLLDLPARFPSLQQLVAECRRQGLVKGFEISAEGEPLISGSLMCTENGAEWSLAGYDASGAVQSIRIPVDAAGTAQAAQRPPEAALPPTSANVTRVIQQQLGDAASAVQAHVAGSPLTITISGTVPHPGVKLQLRRAIDRGIDLPYDANYIDQALGVTTRLGLAGAGHPQGSEMQSPGRLQFSRDGRRLMVFRSGLPQRIDVVDLASGRPAFSFSAPPLQRVRGVHSLPLQALSADGQSGAVIVQGGDGSAVQLFDPAGATNSAPLDRRFVATALSTGPNGQIVAVGGYVPGEGHVLLFAEGRIEPLPLQEPLGVGRCLLEFSPDGRQLAVAETESRTVTLFDVDNRQELSRMTREGLSVTALAWSDDAQFLAVGSHAGDGILLFKLNDGAVSELSGLPGQVRSLDFSPDGTRLASAHFNRGVGLWDVASGRLLNGLEADDAGSDIVQFGEDGDVLYSGIITASQEIRRWDLSGTVAPVINAAPRGGLSAILGLTRRADPGGSLRLVVEYRVSGAAGQECELSLSLRDASGRPIRASRPESRGPAGELRAAWRFTPTETSETSYRIFTIPQGEFPDGELNTTIDLQSMGRSLLPQPHVAAVPEPSAR